MKQSKFMPKWVGAFQVQLTNSFFYISLFNSVMLAITLWSTWGHEAAYLYVPWLNLWLFLVIVFAFMISIMLLDYKYVYPTRQRFLNVQACRHENPAMDLLEKLDKDIQDIKKRLNMVKK